MAPGLLGVIRRRPLPWFFGLAYLLTWSDWIPIAVSRRVVRVGWDPSHIPGLLGPMLAAFAVTIVVGRRAGMADLLHRMGRWRMPLGCWLAAVSPFAFSLGALSIALAAGRGAPSFADFGRMGGLPDMGPLGVWLVMFLVNGYGEETGWRGFALVELQRNLNPLAASLVVAVLWALWHGPSFLILESYLGLGAAVLPGFFLGLASGSVVLTWLYNRSGGSILAVALWHGCYNLVSATLGARGLIAAAVSTAVMVHGLVLVLLEIRARRRTGRWGSVLGPIETS